MFDDSEEEPYTVEEDESEWNSVDVDEAFRAVEEEQAIPSRIGSPLASSGNGKPRMNGFRDPMSHFQQNRGRARDDVSEAGASDAARSNASAASGLARSLPDFEDAHFGHGIVAQAPVIRQEVDSHSSWVDISRVGTFTPIRSMRLNLPIKLFRQDAQFFSQWADQPDAGYPRASAFAAVASLFSAGVSEGILSGNHIELQAADDDAVEGTEKEKPATVTSVRSYVFREDGGRPTPMFLYGVEELTSDDGELLALGVWKHVRARRSDTAHPNWSCHPIHHIPPHHTPSITS
eukprot:444364-Prymnesium_polylepis.1